MVSSLTLFGLSLLAIVQNGNRLQGSEMARDRLYPRAQTDAQKAAWIALNRLACLLLRQQQDAALTQDLVGAVRAAATAEQVECRQTVTVPTNTKQQPRSNAKPPTQR